MNLSLLVLKVRGKRDVVLARERARQVAGLLGFDAVEQACIAAAVFMIACQARERVGQAILQFQVEDGVFCVMPVPRSPADSGTLPVPLRLEKALPQRDGTVALDDLPFVIRQLALHGPQDLFREIQRQNDELLSVLAELQRLRTAMPSNPRELARPAA
jgi:hypothetical protein